MSASGDEVKSMTLSKDNLLNAHSRLYRFQIYHNMSTSVAFVKNVLTS